MRNYLSNFAKKNFSSMDADDLVQDTMLSAWKHRRSFRRGTSMKAWLFFILRNIAYSEFRRRKSHREVPLVGVSDKGEDVSIDVPVKGNQGARMDLSDVLQAMAKLPLDKIDTILLIARGHSYETAAEALGCCVGTVKSRVTRIRRHLTGTCG